MKTKQKEDKTEDDPAPESSGKTRARKKLNADAEEKSQDTDAREATRKRVARRAVVAKKRPLGVGKTLRSKKTIVTRDKVKAIAKPAAKLGRPVSKRNARLKSEAKEEKQSIIPACEIKKEPAEEATAGSRSSSPKTSGPRRQRLTSDIQMMRSALAESPTALLLGSRTSPYSMRSERSNSPFRPDAADLRSGRRRKLKNNLLNEIVKNEQKKRRLGSDGKADGSPDGEDAKKLKRGRSFSRDGSEVSATESDLSVCEVSADGERGEKELKTELDIEEEGPSPLPADICKVPFAIECKSEDTATSLSLIDSNKVQSLKRSTSLDSDNNNRMKADDVAIGGTVDDKLQLKTEKAMFPERDSILTNMSKTFNTKEMTKNIRKARRGRKIQASSRDKKSERGGTEPPAEDSFSKEINDLIETLERCDSQDGDAPTSSQAGDSKDSSLDANIKSAAKFYSLQSPGDPSSKINTVKTVDSPVEEKSKPMKVDMQGETEPVNREIEDGENIRLQISDEDSQDKTEEATKENAKTLTAFKPSTQDIDKLMDKLKHFEELDKKRQQELKAKSETVMVTDDVVLIPKSGADIKPLKDIQATISADKPLDKDSVLSCFHNNSAISIVTKRDHVRKSVDLDLPNSITLIKRNSSSRKESTGSNSGDTISIIEKSLGKDVTLTELRRSIDKPIAPSSLESAQTLHSLATIQPNKPGTVPQSIATIAPSLTITSKDEKPQTNGNETPKIVNKRERRPTPLLVEDTNEKFKLETTNSSLERIKSPPLAVENSVKSPIAEPIKASLQIVKSPPPESKSPLTSLVEASKPSPPQVLSTAPVTIVSLISTELPKDIVTNTERCVLSTVPAPSVDVKSPSLVEIPVTKDEAQPASVTVKIPQQEAPKDTIASPRGDERKPKGETKSPHKVGTSPKETPKLPSPARTSAKAEPDAVPSTSGMLLETPERQKKKESILRILGLVTLKAADEAKIENQKQKEITKSAKGIPKLHSGESSGTLRTVIKLNRGLNTEKKAKSRSSLKLTFQKAKVRVGKPSLDSGDLSESDDTYYTLLHKEGGTNASGSGSNATDGSVAEPPSESLEPAAAKDAPNLVIPEKASSFSIHPGRLCQDQCFYCGGNFGLFDTPCHIAQMKSAERQKKVLDNEEKLTMDSCLCDACYRHVDRRANCPSYRKRPNLVTKPPAPPQIAATTDSDEGQPEGGETEKGAGGRPSTCHAEGCSEPAPHSIRRKWLIKMRNSVSRVVKLQLDYPGLHTIPLCAAHYLPVSQLMVCSLCRRRLTKHHNIHFINHPLEELNPRLAEQGVPVSFAEKPAVCKLCRYFCTLLFRPHQQQNKKHFLKLHRRRLLQTYNIEVPEDSEPEAASEEPKESMEVDPNAGKQKKKNKSGKSKQRKSTDSNKPAEDGADNLDREREPTSVLMYRETAQPMEEDIESLISTNKISKGPDLNAPSDNSDADNLMDVDSSLVPAFDKQSELQYLLQKQNNPAQFLQQPIPNLTQKQRNVLKAHNASAIQKPAAQAKVCEKNAKRIQKLGQVLTQKDKSKKDEECPEGEKKEAAGTNVIKNISLTDECTIESIPPRKAADIAVLKNKWQMSESFTQVKRNLSELSKNVAGEKPKSRSGDSRYSNPVRRLETNPSISVRELFPGEDEMNLQYSVEFNNVKGVTPEGWEKCNTTIQYDVETRKLWHELQKPYGNQSSFLRHLVLLEKYFRSGDLVLAPNANGHAATYSDSVQSRLRAYDNVPEPPKRPQPAVSLIEYRKQKPSSGKSLLKSNQNVEVAKISELKIPPPSPGGKPSETVPKHPKGAYGGYAAMPAPAVFAKPKSRSAPSTSTSMLEMRPPAPKQKSAPPPELISIHTPTPQGRKSIENVLKNIQQLVKGVSAPEPEPMPAQALLPPPPPPPLPPPPPPHKETVKKQKTTTKPWRPTLMQITQENLARIAHQPTQVAVDGRSLPSLVQVMSGGQRYHITLADYNKMCIMRREKLQQVQVVESTAKSKKSTTEVVTEIQASVKHGNGGTVTHNVSVADAQGEPAPRTEEAIRAETNAVNILKNVGLKNITIAPVVEKSKPQTLVSHSAPPPTASSPSLLISSAPIKMAQLGPAVTITSDTLISPGLSITATPMPMLPPYGAAVQPLVMPKIPKSLTVIPQTVPVTSTVVGLPASLVNVQPSMVSLPPSTVLGVPAAAPAGVAQFPMAAPPVAPQP